MLISSSPCCTTVRKTIKKKTKRTSQNLSRKRSCYHKLRTTLLICQCFSYETPSSNENKHVTNPLESNIYLWPPLDSCVGDVVWFETVGKPFPHFEIEQLQAFRVNFAIKQWRRWSGGPHFVPHRFQAAIKSSSKKLLTIWQKLLTILCPCPIGWRRFHTLVGFWRSNPGIPECSIGWLPLLKQEFRPETLRRAYQSITHPYWKYFWNL